MKILQLDIKNINMFEVMVQEFQQFSNQLINNNWNIK